MRRGSTARAVKHLIIAANLGCDYSMKALQQCYKKGEVCEDQFIAARHAYQASVDEMESPQREELSNYERSIRSFSVLVNEPMTSDCHIH